MIGNRPASGRNSGRAVRHYGTRPRERFLTDEEFRRLGRGGSSPPADEARKRATIVIDRIKRGEDPNPKPPEAEPTVSGLAERFFAAKEYES